MDWPLVIINTLVISLTLGLITLGYVYLPYRRFGLLFVAGLSAICFVFALYLIRDGILLRRHFVTASNAEFITFETDTGLKYSPWGGARYSLPFFRRTKIHRARFSYLDSEGRVQEGKLELPGPDMAQVEGWKSRMVYDARDTSLLRKDFRDSEYPLTGVLLISFFGGSFALYAVVLFFRARKLEAAD